MFKKIILICFMLSFLGGCAATHTVISKRKLDVQTKMTDTIFLNPVEDHQQTVYVQIKNTSDKPNFRIDEKVKELLRNKGYKVVTSLNKAQYLVQANILQVGKMDPSAAEQMFKDGYGSMAHSVGAGVATGALIGGGRGNSMLVGGIIGGLASTVSNALVKDVTYTVITDLQISEKADKGVKVDQVDESDLKQGSSSISKQTSNFQTVWKKYRTRIMSTANKVNLKFEDALPLLEDGLTNALTGIF